MNTYKRIYFILTTTILLLAVPGFSAIPQDITDSDSLRLMQLMGNKKHINEDKRNERELYLRRMLSNAYEETADSIVTDSVKQLHEEEIRKQLDSLRNLADSLNIPFSLFTDSTQTLKPFGSEIFQLRDKAVLAPSPIGPVPPNYVLGPGDQIVVSIWGDRELNYSVEVDREGKASIPDLGILSVNGVTLQDFKKVLTRRLSRIYSSLRRGARNATTFIDVSMGKIRPVRIYVFGEVKKPGGYDLIGNSSPWNALLHARGPSSKGSIRKMRIIRNGKQLKTIDGYDFLLGNGTFSKERMENGDILFVPARKRSVYLKGEVEHPAIYEVLEHETLEDLINMAGGFTETAYPYRIQVVRWEKHQKKNVIDIVFDTKEGKNVKLQPGDSVIVLEAHGKTENYYIIEGQVKIPGRYQWQQGKTLKEAVELAGGLTDKAYPGRVDVMHTYNDSTQSLTTLNLGKVLEGDEDTVLLNRDYISIYSVWMFRDSPKISIWGEVNNPGYYDLVEGMDLEDVLFMAGGFTAKAYKENAELSRIIFQNTRKKKYVKIFQVPLPENFEYEKGSSPFTLKSQDMIFIRTNPNWREQKNVVISGEVMFPGIYSITGDNERISNIIKRAGGIKENTAYLEGTVFTRTKDNIGRIALDMKAVLKGQTKNDIALEAGDKLYIPNKSNIVKVVGAVGLPTSILYKKGAGIDYYLNNAGDLTQESDSKHITIILANGKVVRYKRWGFNPEISAGSQIVVPKKPVIKKINSFQIIAQAITALTGLFTMALLALQLKAGLNN